jgi:hypothetical protein
MAHSIGQTFTTDGVKVKVIEQTGCDGCHFITTERCTASDELEPCTRREREDKKSVIFKKVR